MTHRAVAAVCVALLTAIAGCGGVLGGGETPTREPYDVAATPTGTPTPTDAATPTDASAAFRAAVANHTGALRRAGNFTIRYRATDDADAGLWAFADLDAGRYALGGRADGGRITVSAYQNDSGVYRPPGGGDGDGDRDAGLRNLTLFVGEEVATPREAARSLVDLENWPVVEARFERNGTATFDGERMARFTATDPGDFRGVHREIRNVTGFEATALVDDRGILRTVTYAIRGELYVGAAYAERATVTVRDVGATTVPRPRWGNATDPGGR